MQQTAGVAVSLDVWDKTLFPALEMHEAHWLTEGPEKAYSKDTKLTLFPPALPKFA